MIPSSPVVDAELEKVDAMLKEGNDMPKAKVKKKRIFTPEQRKRRRATSAKNRQKCILSIPNFLDNESKRTAVSYLFCFAK